MVIQLCTRRNIRHTLGPNRPNRSDQTLFVSIQGEEVSVNNILIFTNRAVCSS